jgi:GTPase Era involved in 16S rRNA processing
LVDTKLGVVAVCGKYRTGKSYLMNKLFVEQYFQKKKAKMMQKQEQDIKK